MASPEFSRLAVVAALGLLAAAGCGRVPKGGRQQPVAGSPSAWLAGPRIVSLSVSPDGTLIAFSHRLSGAPSSLWLMEAEGRWRRCVWAHDGDTPQDADFSPDSRTLCFPVLHSRLRVTAVQVASAGPDEPEGALTPVATGLLIYRPTWSPDGEAIAYVDTSAGTLEQRIVVLALANGTPNIIVRHGILSSLGNPWPTRDRLFFLTRDATGREAGTPGVPRDLCSIEPPMAGGEVRVWVRGLESAAVGPEGTRAAVTREDDTLSIAHLGPGTEKQVAQGVAPLGRTCWSPDGTKLLFAKRGQPGIHVLQLRDGRVQTLAADKAGLVGGPAWVSGGRGIVFIGQEGRIWRMEADGSGLRQLFP